MSITFNHTLIRHFSKIGTQQKMNLIQLIPLSDTLQFIKISIAIYFIANGYPLNFEMQINDYKTIEMASKMVFCFLKINC